MAHLNCPKCGSLTDSEAAACSTCGHAATNGAAHPTATPAANAAVPAEVSGWILYKTPPELLEWARQTCNEEEFAAALREVERTGGVELKDFIHELEEGGPPRE